VDSATFARLIGWECQSYARKTIILGIRSGLESPAESSSLKEVHRGFWRSAGWFGNVTRSGALTRHCRRASRYADTRIGRDERGYRLGWRAEKMENFARGGTTRTEVLPRLCASNCEVNECSFLDRSRETPRSDLFGGHVPSRAIRSLPFPFRRLHPLAMKRSPVQAGCSVACRSWDSCPTCHCSRSGLQPPFPAWPICCLRLSALECLTSLADDMT